MEAHKEIQKHDQLKYQGLKKKAIKVELKIARAGFLFSYFW